MLWVVGAPLRFFTICFSMVAVGAIVLASTSPSGSSGSRTSSTRSRTTTTPAGSRPTASTRCPPAALFGEGIGASQQKWGDLPEAHTDFIFAVLGEELGLAGTLLVIALFLTIAYAAIRVARRTADPFVRYASFGIVVWLLGQMMINVGMVLALLPVIGIPLPLVSYGGSALLPSLVALGLLVGFARREPEAARALRQREAAALGRPVRGSAPGRARAELSTLSDSMRILLAGGGTAGHTSPLLATADALRRLEPGVRDHLPGHPPRAGEPGRPRGRLPARADPAGAAAAQAERWTCSGCPGRLRGAVRATLAVLDRVRPDVVVGYGGYVSMPAYLAARRRRGAARRPRAERAARPGQQGRRPGRATGSR